jgi:Zn-dependent protease with chaperone function
VTLTQLAAIFRRARSQFAGTRADCSSLVLVDAPCGPSGHCGRRDVAWCIPATRTVYLLRRGLKLSRGQVSGLMLHELGHVADPLIGTHRGAEKRADAIALAITGRRIRYGEGDIQTTGPGRTTRPARLHQ